MFVSMAQFINTSAVVWFNLGTSEQQMQFIFFSFSIEPLSFFFPVSQAKSETCIYHVIYI